MRNQVKEAFEFDPMQLELFSQESIIKRLSNMQNSLGQSKVVNKEKLDLKMGYAFEQSKRYQELLQAKRKVWNENANQKLMISNI